LTVDLSHLPLLNETPQEALAAAKDHLAHIHVGNCLMKDVNHPAYGDNHPPFGIEGGENDVQELVEFLEALFDIRYFTKELPTGRPVVTLEVKPLPDQDSALLIAATKRVWKEAWARLEVGL
jgi:sugar phosphate isomerase/epimerase